MLLETFEEARLADFELFVALDKHGQFPLSQDCVIPASDQVCDQLTLTRDAAFTIRNPV